MLNNEELFQEYYKNRDVALRNKIVENNLYMVEILAKKYVGKGIEYDDLYQVGAIALIAAVERFDPTKGFKFSSFATPTILGEIKKHFRDKGWIVKVPRLMKELASNISKAKESLSNKLGRAPTVAEIAEFVGESEENVIKALESSAAYGALSLNQAAYEDGEEGLYSVLRKYTAKEEKGYDDVENYDIIEKVLQEMTGTNRYIFKKRFVEELSQSEIANKLGVSQMTISRAEKKILARISEELSS